MFKMVKTFAVSILGLSLLLTGCGTSQVTQLEALQGQVQKLEKENESLSKEMAALKEQFDSLIFKETDTTKMDPVIEDIQEDITEETHYRHFAIYGANDETLEPVLIKEIEIDEDFPIEKQLNDLAQVLSGTNFDSLPILVESILEEDGKQIAIINLKEDSSRSKSWAGQYFQGSTGGGITQTSLVETFLQRNFEEFEIDGVRFLYEGNTILFDHVPLLESSILR